jgi:hypothetical protein
MTYPDWFNPHDPFYDDYSIELENFSIPDHFDVYLPDDGNEISCKAIMMPSPRKGAINYIKNSKFILIGIYKDSGRPSTAFPIISNKSWAKSGSELVIFDTTNKVRIGDYVYCYNTNVSTQQYLKCIDRTSSFFKLKLASLVGASSGTSCSYRIDRIKDFFEENIVFRIFPNFKIITYAELQDLITLTSPNESFRTSEVIKNITLEKEVRTPTIINSLSDYSKTNNFKKASELQYSSFNVNINVNPGLIPVFENNQTFDGQGNPLKLKYNEAGKIIPPNYYDSKYKNENVFVDSKITSEDPSIDSSKNDRVWCYDFYGIDINDANRGPYNVDSIISRNDTIDGNVGNIIRLEANGFPIYPTSQYIYDGFGNIVIGINQNNSLNVIRQRIPVQLDNFGRPLKFPN